MSRVERSDEDPVEDPCAQRSYQYLVLRPLSAWVLDLRLRCEQLSRGLLQGSLKTCPVGHSNAEGSSSFSTGTIRAHESSLENALCCDHVSRVPGRRMCGLCVCVCVYVCVYACAYGCLSVLSLSFSSGGIPVQWSCLFLMACFLQVASYDCQNALTF